MKDFTLLRKYIKEEIGRNFHTKNNEPYTFDDFSDYDIDIDGSTEGGFFLTVRFQGKKISPVLKYSSHNEAHHQSRMIVDNDRVKRLNVSQESSE